MRKLKWLCFFERPCFESLFARVGYDIERKRSVDMVVSWTQRRPSASRFASLSGSPVTARKVPSPIYGVTLDDVSNPTSELNALQQLAHIPTTGIVFDEGEPPGDKRIGAFFRRRQASSVPSSHS